MFIIKNLRASLGHVNFRKEAAGQDERAELAADVKVKLDAAPAEILRALAPITEGQQTIVDSLFTDAGVPRFHSFEEISFDSSFEGHRIAIGVLVFEDVKLKGFIILKLHAGAKVDLEFTAQVHPAEDQVGPLAEKIKDDVQVSVGKDDLFAEPGHG